MEKVKNVRRYAMCHSSLYVSHSWRYSKTLPFSLFGQRISGMSRIDFVN